jgi:hydrogenase-4 component F
MLYSGLPSLNLHELLSAGIDTSLVNVSLLKFSFLFIIIGFGTKAALFPMNTWLPDAHGKAPSPVSAFMSSILLPLALYVIYRVKEILDITIPGFANQILLAFGIITLIFSGIILIKQKHFKRALAYSSSEHMGIIAIAFALNAPLIAFAHIIFHGFIKAASFMSAGNVLLELGSGQFDKIKKLFTYMKFTPILLIISLIFLMGIPPSYLFATEIVLIIKSFLFNPWIAVIITLAILLATS